MVFYLAWRIINSVTAFLYPAYASYKALSQRPADEVVLERWLMYWSVLGGLVGVEYVAEWLVSWIPFYHPIKTLFLLYLVLPQTQGAAYVYTMHLQPFLAAHEDQIDNALATFRARALAFITERLGALWETAKGSAGLSPAQAAEANAAAGGASAPPRVGNPISGPVQLAQGLWATYGPGVVEGAQAFLRQQQEASMERLRGRQQDATGGALRPYDIGPPANTALGSTSTSAHVQDTDAIQRRRRELEAELKALAHTPPSPSRSSRSSGEELDAEVSGSEGDRPSASQRRSSWWGWGSPGTQGYEKIKTD